MTNYVSHTSFPKLYKAAILCMYDNGCINRYEPQPVEIETAFSDETLMQAEKELTPLPAEQLDDFCTEEHYLVCQMIDDFGLITADYVLQEMVG